MSYSNKRGVLFAVLLGLGACSGGEPPAAPPEPVVETPPARAEVSKEQLEANADNVALVPSPAEMDMALSRAGIDKKLSNQRFVDNADPAIVDAERERRAELEVELSSLRENLAGL